jgi:hypothetical protein
MLCLAVALGARRCNYKSAGHFLASTERGINERSGLTNPERPLFHPLTTIIVCCACGPDRNFPVGDTPIH